MYALLKVSKLFRCLDIKCTSAQSTICNLFMHIARKVSSLNEMNYFNATSKKYMLSSYYFA
jgi:hypothetical protein